MLSTDKQCITDEFGNMDYNLKVDILNKIYRRCRERDKNKGRLQ
jgi:hypothetical protein